MYSHTGGKSSKGLEAERQGQAQPSWCQMTSWTFPLFLIPSQEDSI